jgi:hypothetical protein
MADDPTINGEGLLPRRSRGRQSAESEAAYQAGRAAFCELVLQIRSSLDFAVGSRGYSYLLEEYGLAKSDFDLAQALINDCRKSGELPIDICAEDGARAFDHVERTDDTTPDEEAEDVLNYVRNAERAYRPVSFWDYQSCYLQMLVEKIDLRNLFSPVCAEFHVPLSNTRGWSDISQRAELMRRFTEHEAEGRRCVLLYCGDHDPAGLQISDTLRKNLADLSGAVGWKPDNLEIFCFGLNADFIERHGLTWIDGLATANSLPLDNPKHPDHRKPYVQDYLAQFGARKCEANALVVRPQEGRQLCREAILNYVDLDGVAACQRDLAEAQQEAATAIRNLLLATYAGGAP